MFSFQGNVVYLRFLLLFSIITSRTGTAKVKVVRGSTKRFRSTRLQVACAIRTVLGGLLPPVESFLVPTLLLWSSDNPPMPCAAAPLPKAVLFLLKSCYVKVIYAQFKGWLFLLIPIFPLDLDTDPSPSFLPHTSPLTSPQLKKQHNLKAGFYLSSQIQAHIPWNRWTLFSLQVSHLLELLTQWGQDTKSFFFHALCDSWGPVSHTAWNLCAELNVNYSLWDFSGMHITGETGRFANKITF